MTWPPEVTVGGKKLGVISMAVVVIVIGFFMKVGELTALAKETRDLAKQAASKEEVLAVAMQVRQLSVRQDSTSVWVLKHDEWSRGQAGKFTEGIQELKDRVTYVERRRDKSEGPADSLVQYGMVKPPKGPPNGRGLKDEWNVRERYVRRRELPE